MIGLVEDAREELAHVADRVGEAHGRVQGGDAREEAEDRGVALDAGADVGAQDLHGDLAAFLRARAVHLRDARGGTPPCHRSLTDAVREPAEISGFT